MFTTTTATREKALIAIAATNRAMDRHVCCKSQFKLRCFSCGEMIHRGDKITRCTTSVKDGMELRFRGADSRNGITFEETAFYLAQTGTRSWVHIGCNPVYWDRELGRLMGVFTDWGSKISYEFDEWRQLTNHYDMEEFMEKHGYPKDKWMKDRIIRNVTRFQAIWRGHIYKKAYPIALRQARATEAINLNARATMTAQQGDDFDSNEWEAEWWEEWRQSERIRRRHSNLWSGEGAEDEHTNESVTITNTVRQWWYGLKVGDHYEGLFNLGQPTEAIYSGEVYEIQYRGDWIKIKIKFHHDGEIRKYTGKKFKLLKEECNKHKTKLGIEAKLVGRLFTACMSAALHNSWRYHYPDGTVVK